VSDQPISTPKKPFKYISLFAGIEAASVAWHPLGWEPQLFCEIEPFPSAVLAQRFPDVPNLGDITKVNWDEWKDKDIDLIIGGSPCQSFSVAGKRLGLDDPRGNLAIEFCRIVDTVRPTWFILENVAGLLSSDGGRDFGALLALMGECGYGVSYRILDSQHFGVPQRRRRVFVVGHLGADWRHSAAVLFEPNSLSGDSPKASGIKRQANAEGSPESIGEGQGWFESSTDLDRRRVKAIGIEGGQARATFGDDLAPTLNCQDDKALVGVEIDDEVWGIGGSQADQWGAVVKNLAPTLHCQSDCSLVAHTQEMNGDLPIGIEGNMPAQMGNCMENTQPTVMAGNERPLVATPTAGAWAVNSRDEVRLIDDDGQKTGTLLTSDGKGQTMIAQEPNVEIFKFDSQSSNSMKSSNPDSGLQSGVEIAPTLDTMQPNPALNQGGLAIVQEDDAVSFQANMSRSKDGDLSHYVKLGPNDGSITPTITKETNPRNAATLVAQPDDVVSLQDVEQYNKKSPLAGKGYRQDGQSYALGVRGSAGVGQPTDVKAFTTKGDGAVFEADMHPTLSSSQGGQAGQGYPAIRREMIVRRLTPLECERLQGFPDNWTRIEWKGKPESECPDGHRYKACGNSMAVPVIRWLGERIEAVDCHVPHVDLPEEKNRVLTGFKDGVAISQDTMDEWFS